MKVFEKIIEVETSGELEFVDITEKVRDVVKQSKIKDGFCLVFAVGATASVFLNECDDSLIKDLKSSLKDLIPDGKGYKHPINARSHLRAILLGNNQCIPIKNNELEIGTWQQIILTNLDTIPRKRKVIIKIIGE